MRYSLHGSHVAIGHLLARALSRVSQMPSPYLNKPVQPNISLSAYVRFRPFDRATVSGRCANGYFRFATRLTSQVSHVSIRASNTHD